MDITLPNGKVISGIPEGTNKWAVAEKAIKAGMATREEFGMDPEVGASDGESFGRNLLEGTGRGMANIGRNVANLAGVEGYSDEELREKSKLDESLMDTGGGMIGSAIGETAVTLPVGGAALAGAKGAARGLQAARGVSQAARGAGVGGRVGAGQLAAAGAGEGAAVGALAAGPDNRGAGAAIGGLAGGGMSGLGSGLRRAREGLVKTSEEGAEMMGKLADAGIDVDMPLSTIAADGGASGLTKFFYNQVLPYMPMAEGTLKRQAGEATRGFQELLVRQAAPESFDKTLMGAGASASRTVQDVAKDLDKYFVDAFDESIGSFKFNVADNFVSPAFKRFEGMADQLGKDNVDRVAGSFRSLMNKYTKDGGLDGSDVGRIKKALTEMGSSSNDPALTKAYQEMGRGLDDMVASQLRHGNNAGNIAKLGKYQELIDKYGHFQDFMKSSARTKAPGGAFTPEDLQAVVTRGGNMRDLAKGTVRNQSLAELGQATIGQGIQRPSLYGRAVIISGILGGGALLGGAPMIALGGGLGRALASKGAQRNLMGRGGMQQGLSRALQRSPTRATSEVAGDILRRGTAAHMAEE